MSLQRLDDLEPFYASEQVKIAVDALTTRGFVRRIDNLLHAVPTAAAEAAPPTNTPPPAATPATEEATVATSKSCNLCAKTKPLDAFARNAAKPDGRANTCKACHNERYGKGGKPRAVKADKTPPRAKAKAVAAPQAAQAQGAAHLIAELRLAMAKTASGAQLLSVRNGEEITIEMAAPLWREVAKWIVRELAE